MGILFRRLREPARVKIPGDIDSFTEEIWNALNDENRISLYVRYTLLNAYGYSKQAFDLWLLRQGLLSQVAGLKYFNVFGPNEQHKGEMRSVVLKAFEQV